MSPAARNKLALTLIHQYGGIEGEHHKQWVLDQVVRALLEHENAYLSWVSEFNLGNDGTLPAPADGPNVYEWQEGIAP